MNDGDSNSAILSFEIEYNMQNKTTYIKSETYFFFLRNFFHFFSLSWQKFLHLVEAHETKWIASISKVLVQICL